MSGRHGDGGTNQVMGSSGGGSWIGVRGLGRAPSLTSVRGTVLAGSGDMMIDGVVPLGVWPRQSL
jgi:hypothetical protein